MDTLQVIFFSWLLILIGSIFLFVFLCFSKQSPFFWWLPLLLSVCPSLLFFWEKNTDFSMLLGFLNVFYIFPLSIVWLLCAGIRTALALIKKN